jgi:FKBP-type peptidyl-prolyl cis-trans isomerase
LPVADAATSVVAPTEQVNQAKQTVNQIEAYVRNDSKLASNNKLTKRIERVKSLLNSAVTKTSSASTTNVASKKMTLLERVAVKRIDKRIKNKLAPDQTMAKSMFTIGIIVAAAGLVLLLIGNGFGAALGGIALVVGLVLIILDLVQS